MSTLELTPDTAYCLRHTERYPSIMIPFYSYSRITALYYLDRIRYAAYFDDIKNPHDRSKLRTNWHQAKWDIQTDYMRKLEDQGKVLKDIFMAREAHEETRAVDYLLWINYQWELYVKNVQRGEFKFDNFIDFVQSDLSKNIELGEPGKNE